MENTIYQYIKTYNLICNGDSIVLGLSGGADSVALFYVLMSFQKHINFSLFAVHVNHNVRGADALHDEQFCVNLCQRHCVPIRVYNADMLSVAMAKKISSEDAGRLIRYNAFSEASEFFNANKIATAHNKNDQAETVLMRMIRGSGTKGLSAIRASRDNIIRPLLCVKRSEIEIYLNEGRSAYCHDKTNDTDDYSRNIVRHHIIPPIEQALNPVVVDSLSRLADNLHEDNMFIEYEAEKTYTECLCSGNSADISKLLCYPNPILKRIINRLYYNAAGTSTDLLSVHIEQIMSLLRNKTGKKIYLPHNVEVYIEYCLIYFKQYDKINKSFPFSYKLLLENAVYIPETGCNALLTAKNAKFSNIIYTKALNYASISNGVYLRNRRSGDKIYLDKVGSKKLSDFFSDRKIPKAERDKIPLLTINGEIACIAAKRSDIAFYNSRFISSSQTNDEVYFVYWEDKQ